MPSHTIQGDAPVTSGAIEFLKNKRFIKEAQKDNKKIRQKSVTFSATNIQILYHHPSKLFFLHKLHLGWSATYELRNYDLFFVSKCHKNGYSLKINTKDNEIHSRKHKSNAYLQDYVKF
jgi:hypothetical protein